MRASTIGLMALCLLPGCNGGRSAEPAGPRSQGRYAGIGVFDAGRLWAQMSGAASATDPAAAGIADDEHVIVVLDSHTGEVRQCGDHSGYCVAMSPWSGSPPRLPAKLAKHAADLASEDGDKARVADPSPAANAPASEK